jgi:hypothetical protein
MTIARGTQGRSAVDAGEEGGLTPAGTGGEEGCRRRSGRAVGLGAPPPSSESKGEGREGPSPREGRDIHRRPWSSAFGRPVLPQIEGKEPAVGRVCRRIDPGRRESWRGGEGRG